MLKAIYCFRALHILGLSMSKRITVSESVLRAIVEGRVRVLDKRIKLGKYRIVKRYIVVGVVSGCSGKS